MKKGRRELKKKASPVAAVVWTVVAIIWIAIFCAGLFTGALPHWHTALKGFTALVSSAAAVVNFIHYRDNR